MIAKSEEKFQDDKLYDYWKGYEIVTAMVSRVPLFDGPLRTRFGEHIIVRIQKTLKESPYRLADPKIIRYEKTNGFENT